MHDHRRIQRHAPQPPGGARRCRCIRDRRDTLHGHLDPAGWNLCAGRERRHAQPGKDGGSAYHARIPMTRALS